MAERESNRRKENTARQGVPVEDLEQFARFLLPKIQAFYETEEGQRAFQEWKENRSRYILRQGIFTVPCRSLYIETDKEER